MTTDTDYVVTRGYRSLEVARRALVDEVSAYPAPISGFGAHFKQLLSLRIKIIRGLDELEAEVFVPRLRNSRPLAGVDAYEG